MYADDKLNNATAIESAVDEMMQIDERSGFKLLNLQTKKNQERENQTRDGRYRRLSIFLETIEHCYGPFSINLSIATQLAHTLKD